MDKESLQRRACALALAYLLCLSAQAGTKHDFARPVFVYAFHPDVPLSRFASGSAGIPEPQHARLYLFAAYRAFEGRPLSQAEQQRWLRVWDVRANRRWPERRTPQAWNVIRQRVPLPHSAPPKYSAYVQLRNYVQASLCGDDAYAMAAQTLTNRIRRYGATSPEVRFWTEGQDVVFRACETATPHPLATAPESLPQLIRADREYQIAAAYFYGQQFEDALSAFRRIAQDKTSPWRIWAPYLMGRTLLWKARYIQAEVPYRQALKKAEAQFRMVLGNAKFQPTHSAAEYLLLRCMLVTNPGGALPRIGRRLARGNWQESDLLLYLNELDWMEDLSTSKRGQPTSRVQWPADSLSRWILAFEGEKYHAFALQQWRQAQSRAWLYAALWNAGSDAPDELTDAALSADLSEPGGTALHYAAIQVLGRKGQFDKARQYIEPLFTALASFPSAQNRVAGLRAQLAQNWQEFLERAPRPVIYAASEWDTTEWRSQDKPDFRWITPQSLQTKEAAARSHQARCGSGPREKPAALR